MMLQRLSITFDSVLKLFLFLSPMLWLPGITQNGIQTILFNYGSLILFGISVSMPPKRECKNYNILIILAVCSIASIIVNYKAYPIYLIHVISGCLFYYSFVRSTKDILGIIKTLAIVALINFIIAMAQAIGIPILYQETSSNRIIQSLFTMPGLMGRNYHLAYYLNIVAPFCFAISSWAGITAVTGGLIVSLMVGSYACIATSLMIILVLIFRKLTVEKMYMSTIITWMLLFVGFLAIFAQGNLSEKIVHKLNVRRASYEYVLKEALVNPFKGQGIGSFETDENINKYASSFNQFLRIIFEIGIIPFSIIMTGLIRFYKPILGDETLFKCALIGLFIFPMFHEVLRFPRLIVLILTVFAIMEIYYLNNKEGLKCY